METITYKNILFKQIKEHKDYYVSKCGKVLSNNLYRRKYPIMLKGISQKGYNYVTISNNNKYKLYLIHRLVAETFIPNSENKPQVNHINGIKTDNAVENLEWCTRSENMKHAYRLGLQKPNLPGLNKFGELNPVSRKVSQHNLNGDLIKNWDCIKDASNELNIDNSSITKVCKNKNKTVGGFIWKYIK
jgi:hypothetical protein